MSMDYKKSTYIPKWDADKRYKTTYRIMNRWFDYVEKPPTNLYDISQEGYLYKTDPVIEEVKVIKYPEQNGRLPRKKKSESLKVHPPKTLRSNLNGGGDSPVKPLFPFATIGIDKQNSYVSTGAAARISRSQGDSRYHGDRTCRSVCISRGMEDEGDDLVHYGVAGSANLTSASHNKAFDTVNPHLTAYQSEQEGETRRSKADRIVHRDDLMNSGRIYPNAPVHLQYSKSGGYDDHHKAYLQFQKLKITPTYPRFGPPRLRHGRAGGGWRHVREVIQARGPRTLFVQGDQRLTDNILMEMKAIPAGNLIQPSVYDKRPSFSATLPRAREYELNAHRAAEGANYQIMR